MRLSRHMIRGFIVALCLTLGGCVSELQCQSGTNALAMSHWRLVFHNTADQRHTESVNGSAGYEISLIENGKFEMKFGCNQAIGRWSARPANIQSGSVKLRAMAMKPSSCPLSAFDAKIAGGIMRVKSYKMDGEFMQFRADRESYTWKRLSP